MAVETHDNSMPCPLCMLGAVLIGATLLYLLYAHASSEKALWIQQDIESRSLKNINKEIPNHGLTLRADGRDVFLSGHVKSEEQHNLAKQITTHTHGVRTVHSEITVNPNQKPVTRSMAKATLRDIHKAHLKTIPKARLEPLPAEFASLEENQSKPDDNAQPTGAIEETFASIDFAGITFKENASTLTDTSQSTLDEVAKVLHENSNINISVEGHTDTSGDPELNLKLSEKRAQSVVNYLVESGIDNSRIQAQGFGDQHPIASNESLEGRKQNRRIEIKVINGE